VSHIHTQATITMMLSSGTTAAALASCVFLLLLTTPLTTAKKLVVFAGPHETSGVQVNEFFANHAADENRAEALAGWTWPTVEENTVEDEEGIPPMTAHHLFDLLMTEQENEIVRVKLLDVIQDAYENSVSGVILGSLLFDRVFSNPETNFDAITALQTVVDTLGMAPEDVVVAMTYRAPRVDQWAAVFTNHFDYDTYADFVCSTDTQVNKRWEWLDTSMNPLGVAKEYYDQGYEILMIDQTSAANAGKDVAHLIACTAMDGVQCEDDWLVGLEDEEIELPPVLSLNDDDLDQTDYNDLEQLFRSRDCFYMTQFDGQQRFQFLNSEITDCELPLRTYYGQFADTDFLLNAIQSQKGCQTTDVDLAGLFAQKEIVSTGSVNSKKLVIFVGPHETQAEDVIKFFATHASTHDGSEYAPGFNGWMWPDINTGIQAGTANHRIFDVLVTQKDEELQNEILDGILKSWNAAERGLILGSVLFDGVDFTPYSGYDGVAAVRSIVDKLGIEDKHVAIVLSYRSPRIDHWGVVWKYHFEEASYKDFICSETQSKKRWEWLNTVLNPFQIAFSYFDEGFRVVAMDQSGIIDAGLDIAHSISCEILEGIDCEDGFVRGLNEVKMDAPPSVPIDELSDSERADLETLFRKRDCYFQDVLDGSHRFHILNDHGAWDDCTSADRAVYDQLVDTDVFMNALMAQLGCEAFVSDLPAFLGHATNSTNTGSETSDNEEQEETDNVPVNTKTEKKLVIFAGPHETSADDVNSFLSTFVSPDNSDYAESFQGWIWPTVDEDGLDAIEPHLVFDLLMADPRGSVQDDVINAIKNGWNQAEKGVIIGALDFDKIGLNPSSHLDPLGAVNRVVGELGIQDKDVTIVLTYRAPRVDHWSAVWYNHFQGRSYDDFICSSDDKLASKRWEWIDTVMNPMKIASAYVEQGWNVAVMDYDGVSRNDHDIGHVLACQIMQDVDCVDGWIKGLEDVRMDPLETFDIEGLYYTDRNELEQAFMYRDCYYKTMLEANTRFSVIDRRKLWENCPAEKSFQYDQLESTDFFLKILQSQMQCVDTPIELSSFLSGSYSGRSSGGDPLLGLSISVSILALFATGIAAFMILRKRRRAEKSLKAAADPSEGVFRDTPSDKHGNSLDHNIRHRGPFRDNSGGRNPNRAYEYEEDGRETVPSDSDSYPSANVFHDLDLTDTENRAVV
jgi:hypothetical protein